MFNVVGAMAAGAMAAGAVRRWCKTAAVEAATAAHTQATERRRARGGEEGPAGIAVIRIQTDKKSSPRPAVRT